MQLLVTLLKIIIQKKMGMIEDNLFLLVIDTKLIHLIIEKLHILFFGHFYN